MDSSSTSTADPVTVDLSMLDPLHNSDDDDDDFVSSSYKVVTPGETIGLQDGFLRGHGTYTEQADGSRRQSGQTLTLVASVCGVVERVNKLIKVDPLRARYRGDIGDLVVGRIEEVGEKSWKVDVGAAKSAVLMLSSVRFVV